MLTFEEFRNLLKVDPYRGVHIDSNVDFVPRDGEVFANLAIDKVAWRNPRSKALLVMQTKSTYVLHDWVVAWTLRSGDWYEWWSFEYSPGWPRAAANILTDEGLWNKNLEQAYWLTDVYEGRLYFLHRLYWELLGWPWNRLPGVRYLEVQGKLMRKAYRPVFDRAKELQEQLSEERAAVVRGVVGREESPPEPERLVATVVDPYAGDPDMPPPYYGDITPRPPRFPWRKEAVRQFRHQRLREGYDYNPADGEVVVLRGMSRRRR